MMKTAIERRKEKSFRYQIQVRPGMTRLIAEFDESQADVMKRFFDLLFHTEGPQENNDDKTKAATSSRELAVVASDN